MKQKSRFNNDNMVFTRQKKMNKQTKTKTSKQNKKQKQTNKNKTKTNENNPHTHTMAFRNWSNVTRSYIWNDTFSVTAFLRVESQKTWPRSPDKTQPQTVLESLLDGESVIPTIPFVFSGIGGHTINHRLACKTQIFTGL